MGPIPKPSARGDVETQRVGARRDARTSATGAAQVLPPGPLATGQGSTVFKLHAKRGKAGNLQRERQRKGSSALFYTVLGALTWRGGMGTAIWRVTTGRKRQRDTLPSGWKSLEMAPRLLGLRQPLEDERRKGVSGKGQRGDKVMTSDGPASMAEGRPPHKSARRKLRQETRPGTSGLTVQAGQGLVQRKSGRVLKDPKGLGVFPPTTLFF